MTPTQKKSSKFFISAAAGVLALFLSAGVTFAEVDKGDADMILQTTKAKKPATFPHAKHQAVLSCAACHHSQNEDGSQKAYVDGQEIGKCVSCHNKESMANKKLNSFKNAGHENCKSCHKEMAAAKKPTGPTKCGGCHIKI